MDTMLILHIMLFSIAAVSSYSYNKTIRTPITYTVSKVIDLTKPSNETSTGENRRSGTQSLKNPTNISKRQDPPFGSSLSSFDEPSGATFSDSLSGFRDKPSTKDAFDIDDIDIKSTPSFGIDDSRIKSSPSFGIVSPKIKESSSFDIDSSSFSLDGGNFHADDAAFNIESTAFEEEEEEDNQEKEDPSFSIDSDFENDESTTKRTDTFASDFSGAKRSPPYNSGRNKGYSEPDAYRPQASNSRSKSYDSSPKAKYSKNQGQSYQKGQGSYANPSGPVYSDTNVQYVGSSATPINYVTTPHDKFDSPLADGSKFTDQAFKGFGQGSFQNSLFDQGAFGQNSFQSLNGNSFLQNGYLNPPATQTPVYTTQYPGPKNSQQIFTPTHQTTVNLPQSTQSFESLSSSLPTHIENKDFSGFIHSLESEPVVLNSGNNFNFQAPNFGIPFDFGTETQNQPFLSAHVHQQQRQVLPVQTSSSTPQFPQYKGASIQAHSRSDFANPPGGYQFLTNQPQLHFNPNSGPIDRAHVNNPFERIRTDVEVINKKKPAPPQRDDRDEEGETEEDTEETDELDDGYKSIEQEYSQSEEDESSKAQINSDEGSSESYSLEEPLFKNMPSMSPFSFQPYDDKFGKIHEFVNQNEPQSRFSVESSADDDEDYSPKEYASINSSSSEYDGSDDEEESKKFEKQEDDGPSVFPAKGLEALRNYDLQFERKFNLPHNKDVLKNKFAEDRASLPNIAKYKKKTNFQGSAESMQKNVKAGIKSPIKRISKNNEEDETRLNFQIYDSAFGHKIPKKIGDRQKVESSSRFKKDNSRQQNSSKKNDKSSEAKDSYVRPSQAVKNIAFITEDDYNFFSPQRIKSSLNGGLF